MSRAILGLLVLGLVACATTPTDKYYTALTALSGVRASAISYCKMPTTPVQHCEAMRDLFFIPGDAAIASAESARQAVLSACVAEPESPSCQAAGRKLSQASAGMVSLSKDLSKFLAAYGVNTK